MPIVSETDYRFVGNREYWVDARGNKLFPDQFDDEHLLNTIKMLHRRAKEYRLEEARKSCVAIYRTGYGDVDIQTYYHHFRDKMNQFLDASISECEWLKCNSKIYILLCEEAKFRSLEIPEETSEEPMRRHSNDVRVRRNISRGASRYIVDVSRLIGGEANENF